jgi:hypothetical protein
MNRRSSILVAALVLAASGIAHALEDPGKAVIARVRVAVYHATNGNPDAAGVKAVPVPQETARRLRKEEKLRFKNYRLLGEDTQPLFRSYENWAQPLRPSEEILVKFEAQGRPDKHTAILDLELWLGRKKAVKTDIRLEGERALYMLGPEWRGGRLIIAVALAPRKKTGS